MNEALEEKKMGPNHSIFPCNLHVVHYSFWEGLNLYGTQAEELAFDLHYSFKRSPCKLKISLNCMKTLNCMIASLFDMHKQDGALPIPALERIQKKWPILKKYFLDFLPKDAKESRTKKFLQENARYQKICLQIQEENKTCAQIAFLLGAAPIFTRFLKLLQSCGPLVHVLYTELKEPWL